MNIGILTLTHRSNLNYGAALQAWALKIAVEKYTNNKATVIPLEPEPLYKIRSKYEGKENWGSKLRKFFATAKLRLKQKNENARLENYKRYKRFQYFLKNFAFEGKLPFYISDFEREIDGIDTLIIGSDWVWYLPERLLNANPSDLSHEKALYLGFLPQHCASSPSLIAYAASQGIVPTTPSTLLRRSLNNFSSVSVREAESAQYLIKNGTCIPIHQVVDPTLLLEKDDLAIIDNKSFLSDNPNLKKGYILVYELPIKNSFDPLPQYVKDLSKKTGLDICNVSTHSDAPNIPSKPLGEKLGPMEFLTLIRNSQYVVTNSFHGMVFASIYHKPFTAFQRQANDFRQTNLVRLLGLENRLLPFQNRIFEGMDIDPFLIEPNWENVDNARRVASTRSIDFLTRSLDNGHSSH